MKTVTETDRPKNKNNEKSTTTTGAVNGMKTVTETDENSPGK